MIGQGDVIETLKKLDARSIILSGPKHWGKKTLLRELFSKYESVYEITGNATDFRDSLERIYSTVRPTIYLVPDLDESNMTVQNLLLKVLEEPPQSSRFYITASGAVLPTISSRCLTVRMKPYRENDLMAFPLDNSFIGMGSSPGIRKLLSISGSVETAQKLKTIIGYLEGGKTLAFALKEYRAVEDLVKEFGIPHDWFLTVLPHMCKPGAALDWLRRTPDDNPRYVRKTFLMLYHLEHGGLV